MSQSPPGRSAEGADSQRPRGGASEKARRTRQSGRDRPQEAQRGRGRPQGGQRRAGRAQGGRDRPQEAQEGKSTIGETAAWSQPGEGFAYRGRKRREPQETAKRRKTAVYPPGGNR